MTSPVRWMQGVAAVGWREFTSVLVTPLGWCVMAAFAALAGAVFAFSGFQSGAPATLRATFIALGWAVLVTAPALSMRSIAEERRHGTWQALAAAPAGTGAATLGKFGAATSFLALCIALPLAAQLAALEWCARPDYGEALTAFLGLTLAGCAYVASGILMSALTGSQVGAYLLTLFLWLTWIVAAKGTPSLLSAQWAYVAFELDPLRRLDDFLLGVLDTSNVAFFACIAAAFASAAALVVARPLLPSQRAGWARAAIAATAVAVLAVGVVGISGAPSLRATWDMTKTRAYTLSPGTQALLSGLRGEWTIAVVLDSTGADPSVLRQVDEVLARMAGAGGGHVQAMRVDPGLPQDAARYERLLELIQARDAPAMTAYAAAIATGQGAFDRLVRLAAAEQADMAQVLARLSSQSADRALVESLRAAFAQLTAQKPAFDRSLRELRTASEARPFPDEARAAGALASNVGYWSEQLQAAARSLSQRQRDRIDEAALAAWLEGAVAKYLAAARDLRAAQDALEQLPRLHGAEVGAALARGDAGIVVGPPGVAVIAGSQLVAGRAASGAVAFDRRFRGEQLVAAAMRGMGGLPPPVAVVMHSGAPGILKARADHADLAACADALRSARMDAVEWIPGEGAEPVAPKDRRLVWIVIPPADRDASEENPRDRALLAAAERLAARGEPMLISVGPSLLPILGQRDPWAELLRTRGVRAETGKSVLEVVPVGPAKAQVATHQELRDFSTAHAIGSAIDGQLARFDRVVPLRMDASVRGQVLAAVQPSQERWIETDWRRDQHARLAAPADKMLTEPVAVVVAVERGSGGSGGSGARDAATVRTVAVGSPLWISSAVADIAETLGGGRAALRYPGNRELLVNAVAWLAGRDDLIASAGAGREVERLPTLSRAERLAVSTAESVLLPGALGAVGAGIVLRRRWRT